MHLKPLLLVLLAAGSSFALEAGGPKTSTTTSKPTSTSTSTSKPASTTAAITSTTSKPPAGSTWLDALNKDICGQRLIKPHHARNWPRRLDREFGERMQTTEETRDTLASYMSAGYRAYKGQFPWLTSIRSQHDNRTTYPECGGLIIHKDLVLTAAHCLVSRTNVTADRITVYAGVTHLWDMSRSQKRIGAQVTSWKHFKRSAVRGREARKSQDLAVIRVEAPFKYNEFVQPICLPDAGSEWDGQKNCVGVGLGFVDTRFRRRARNVMIMPMRVCQSQKTKMEDEICYESANPRQYPGSLCPGDDGNGLICSEDPKLGDQARFYAVGVQSSLRMTHCHRGHVKGANFVDLVLQRELLLKMAQSSINTPL